MMRVLHTFRPLGSPSVWQKLPRPASNPKGMALILTLVIMAILTAMVVEFSYGVFISHSALHNWQSAQQLSLVAHSGLQLAAQRISEDLKGNYTYPGSMETIHKGLIEGVKGDLILRVEDESSKVNLNTLVYPNGILNEGTYASLTRMLQFLGLDRKIADRIADWIDPDDDPRLPDSEGGFKNGTLESLDEILLIPGVEKGDYEKLRPHITLYGSGLININGADLPVLMGLSDQIDQEKAKRIIYYRERTPFEKPEDVVKVAGFETLWMTLMSRITVKGSFFRVTSIASDGNAMRVIEVIMEGSSESPVIRYWKEW